MKIGAREKEIIKAVGVGVFVVASFVMPGLPIALAPFIKRQGPKRFKQTLRTLEEKGVVYLSGEKVKLTSQGKKLLAKIETEEINIIKPSKWDGIWRVVAFDIPEKLRKERDWLRESLRHWGFKKIQKSIWVFPYECKQEIATLSHYLRVAPYVIYMQTDTLPQEDRLRKYFSI